MKKHIIYILIALILIIILLISYTIISAKTPITSKIVKMDKDNIIYEVRNISPVNYYYGRLYSLQYKENNRWVDVKPKDDYVVTSEMLCLAKFGISKKEFRFSLNEEFGELKGGEYRIERIFDREEKGKYNMEYKIYIYFDI